MSIEYSFFDPTVDENGLPDREYNAEQFTNYFGALVETGIMRQHEQELKVAVDDSTMNSTIGTGVAFVEDKYMRVKSPYLLAHDTESVGLNRIDRIVVRKDTRIESRHVLPFIKKGVASANPVAPSLQRDDEVYEISLAQIKVVGGRSYLTISDVTDERADESLCGWATSKIMPNYSDDTLQGVLTQVQENEVRIGNHEKNAINHVAYGVATGTNVKTMIANIQFDNLVDGLAVAFKNNTANTGPVTLNVNSKGVKNVVKPNGNQLNKDDLHKNGIYTVRYNSSTGNFILEGEGGVALKSSIYQEILAVINAHMTSIQTNGVIVAGTSKYDTLILASMDNRGTNYVSFGVKSISLNNPSSMYAHKGFTVVPDGVVFFNSEFGKGILYDNNGNLVKKVDIGINQSPVTANSSHIYAKAGNNFIQMTTNLENVYLVNSSLNVTQLLADNDQLYGCWENNVYRLSTFNFDVLSTDEIAESDNIQLIGTDQQSLYSKEGARLVKRNKINLNIEATVTLDAGEGIAVTDDYLMSNKRGLLSKSDLTPLGLTSYYSGNLISSLDRKKMIMAISDYSRDFTILSEIFPVR